MHRAMSCLLASSAFLLASSAASAAPVGTLTCSGPSGASANLSSLEIGGTAPNVLAGGSGVGVGRVQLLPLTVHAALSQFQTFYKPFYNGTVFPTCVLTSSAAGQTFKVVLKDAEITSFAASVSNNTPANGGSTNASAFVEFTLAYTAITVDATGADDGGTPKLPTAKD